MPQAVWNRELHARLLAGIEAVGAFQLEAFGAMDPESAEEKGGPGDLVTWVDRESEARLGSLLAELLPEAGQFGEEGLRREGDGDLTWIVDPLDGTTNFTHGHPFFAISVALQRDGVPLLGAIHAPRLGETFHGYAGGGAWLGDAPLAVSASAEPARALFATGFADRRKLRSAVNMRNYDRVCHASRGVRRAGAAALDMAFTAAGRLGGFWEMGLGPWDVAAGIFLVREAGGRVSDFEGAEAGCDGRHIVASNGLLHDWLLGQLELEPYFARETP